QFEKITVDQIREDHIPNALQICSQIHLPTLKSHCETFLSENFAINDRNRATAQLTLGLTHDLKNFVFSIQQKALKAFSRQMDFSTIEFWALTFDQLKLNPPAPFIDQFKTFCASEISLIKKMWERAEALHSHCLTKL